MTETPATDDTTTPDDEGLDPFTEGAFDPAETPIGAALAAELADDEPAEEAA